MVAAMNVGKLTRTEAEKKALELNRATKDRSIQFQTAYAGNSWRVERFKNGVFDGVEAGAVLHGARREGDEMACRCGVRWPVGEEHP